MDLFAILFYQPIYNFMILIYNLFGQNLGLAIIAIGVFFRLVTIPITLKQIKVAQDSREMQKKMNELKSVHKNDQKKLQEEQLKLQQEYLPGQIGGCLPMLVQLVVLSQVYIVLNNIFNRGTISFNEVAYGFMPKFAEGATFNTGFLGINLASSPGKIGYTDLKAVLPYLALAVLVALTQLASTRILMGMRQRKADTDKPVEVKKKPAAGEKPDDFGEIMQRSTQQTMYIFPIMIGFFALNFPAGLALYWTTQNTFVIIQQFIIDKIQNRGRK